VRVKILDAAERDLEEGYRFYEGQSLGRLEKTLAGYFEIEAWQRQRTGTIGHEVSRISFSNFEFGYGRVNNDRRL
jgi:hypothetical protein